jgi:hypothetical protein
VPYLYGGVVVTRKPAMAEIKGSQLINLVNSIQSSFGEDGYRRILDGLSFEFREIFEDHVLLASKWYPFDAYIEMLKMDVALFHHGDETEFEPKYAIFENIVIAFFRSALLISGAKNVQAVFTQPISLGGPFAEITVSWD